MKYLPVIDTDCQGTIPWEWSDDDPIMYDSKHEAEVSIADEIIERMQSFKDGHFEDLEQAKIEDVYVVKGSVVGDNFITKWLPPIPLIRD